jgi:hypothetical protein
MSQMSDWGGSRWSIALVDPGTVWMRVVCFALWPLIHRRKMIVSYHLDRRLDGLRGQSGHDNGKNKHPFAYRMDSCSWKMTVVYIMVDPITWLAKPVASVLTQPLALPLITCRSDIRVVVLSHVWLCTFLRWGYTNMHFCLMTGAGILEMKGTNGQWL